MTYLELKLVRKKTTANIGIVTMETALITCKVLSYNHTGKISQAVDTIGNDSNIAGSGHYW